MFGLSIISDCAVPLTLVCFIRVIYLWPKYTYNATNSPDFRDILQGEYGEAILYLLTNSALVEPNVFSLCHNRL